MPDFASGSVTVVETLYLSRPGREPVSVASAFEYRVPDAQPYRRELAVGPEWTPLDPGWVKAPRLLVLSPRGGSGKEGVTVRSGEGPPFARVRPGESLRVEPLDVSALSVRAEGGAAELEILIVGGA